MLGISDGIDTVGDIRWELLGYLVVAWVGAYLVVWKGLHNSSKVGEEGIGLCVHCSCRDFETTQDISDLAHDEG